MTDRLRILGIAAHPDDLDFGCAGTTASLTDKGHEVEYCIVTDGQSGGFDRSVSRIDMADIRRNEQTAAAKVLGVEKIHFLGFLDGSVEVNLKLRKAIARVIRQVRPDRVVTHAPFRHLDRMYGSHPDHLATGEAALCAVYPDARNEFAFPELLETEGLEPHKVPEVWIIGGPDANHYVDITDHFDRKIEALRCHESQMQEPEKLSEMITGWNSGLAEEANFAEGRLAENYRVIETA